MDNIRGSLICSEYALNILRKEPLTCGNADQLNGTVQWLQSISNGLKEELGKLFEKSQKPAGPKKKK